MPDPESIARIAAAINTPKKARILLLLLDTSYSTQQLHEITGYPAPNINNFLKSMQEVDLVYSYRESYSVYYRGTKKARLVVRAFD